MPKFMVRGVVNGKLIGKEVEQDTEPTKEEAEAIINEAALDELEKAFHPESSDEDVPISSPAAVQPRRVPRAQPELDGRTFDGLSFRCSTCQSPLTCEFRDGYLQLSPCPTCLGELEKIVEATKRFSEKRK